MESSQELKSEMLARRAARYYGGVAYAWNGPAGMIKLGVLQGIGDTYIIGSLRESGSACAFKSTALRKHYPTHDPNELLSQLHAWAQERGLQRVEP